MKFKKLISMEKEVTEKRYKPLIDKIKKLRDISIKEEIAKRNYVADENSKINPASQAMICRLQLMLLVSIGILQIILLCYPFFTEKEMNISFYPMMFRVFMVIAFLLISIINDIASIASGLSNKTIEAFQAVSSGLIFAIIAIQTSLLFLGEKVEMSYLGGNIIIPALLVVAIIVSLIKKNKLKNKINTR